MHVSSSNISGTLRAHRGARDRGQAAWNLYRSTISDISKRTQSPVPNCKFPLYTSNNVRQLSHLKALRLMTEQYNPSSFNPAVCQSFLPASVLTDEATETRSNAAKGCVMQFPGNDGDNLWYFSRLFCHCASRAEPTYIGLGQYSEYLFVTGRTAGVID